MTVLFVPFFFLFFLLCLTENGAVDVIDIVDS